MVTVGGTTGAVTLMVPTMPMAACSVHSYGNDPVELKVLVNANGLSRKLELFWFPLVPVLPPGLGKSHANGAEVLTTLWSSEPVPQVQITSSPAWMFDSAGEKESLTTDTLVTAPLAGIEERIKLA